MQPLNPANVMSQLATSIRVEEEEEAEQKRYVQYVGNKGDSTLVSLRSQE